MKGNRQKMGGWKDIEVFSIQYSIFSTQNLGLRIEDSIQKQYVDMR